MSKFFDRLQQRPLLRAALPKMLLLLTVALAGAGTAPALAQAPGGQPGGAGPAASAAGGSPSLA
jgi:hypothetical protein